jgi:hypothetical protein
MNDIYVLVLDKDVSKKEGRPIVVEQYIDGDNATLEAIKERRESWSKSYGRGRIAKLEFTDE